MVAWYPHPRASIKTDTYTQAEVGVVARTSVKADANVPSCDTAAEAPCRSTAAAFRLTEGRRNERTNERTAAFTRASARDSRPACAEASDARFSDRRERVAVIELARTPRCRAAADRNSLAPQQQPGSRGETLNGRCGSGHRLPIHIPEGRPHRRSSGAALIARRADEHSRPAFSLSPCQLSLRDELERVGLELVVESTANLTAIWFLSAMWLYVVRRR